MEQPDERRPLTPIAVVGMTALFPDSMNAPAFWRHILEGTDLLSDIPSTHWLTDDYYAPGVTQELKTYVNRGGFIPAIDFDPLQFGLPPHALSATDTAQLIALVTTQRLLQDVRSVQQGKVEFSKTSIILGTAPVTELAGQMESKLQRPVWVKALRESGLPESKVEEVCQRLTDSYPAWTESTFPGLLGNVVAGRIANRFDLGGTNCVVDAACASSLAALAMAMQELRSGATNMSLTGGMDTLNNIFMFMCFTKTPALSPTNECRPFASNADGTMLGEGFGMLALRRLKDAERDGDHIYAVIRGLGSSSDGKAKSVYAPRPSGQALAIKRAYEQAGWQPTEVELVEAHGTATLAGDAAEFEGLQEAFGTEPTRRRQWCALGSIKSQIGHTKAAAGAASLLKVILALHHKVLPPTIKVDQPNPNMDWDNSPFYLNTYRRPWIHDPTSTRKASVSSFGFGGSNFHAVVEEYTGPGVRPLRVPHAPAALLMLSAEDPNALTQDIYEMRRALEQRPLATIARLYQETFEVSAPVRLACLARDVLAFTEISQQVLDHLASQPNQRLMIPNQVIYHPVPVPRPKLAFLFPGQGSQYLNMGRELAIEFEAARHVWDQAAHLSWDNDLRLDQAVFPIPVFDNAEQQQQEDRLTRTEWAQPAIGAVSLSQLALLEQAEIRADCVAGHRYGEIPALYAAGALESVEEVLTLSRKRGELMQEASAGEPGAMTAVRSSITEIEDLLAQCQSTVRIANINSPKQVVLTGRVDDITEVEAQLQQRAMAFRRLPVATAFHSEIVGGSLSPFRQFLQSVRMQVPRIPVYANLTAEPYPDDPQAMRDTLVEQLAHPVRFQDQIEAMYANGVRLFLEVGPKATLGGLVDDCLPGREDYMTLSLDHHRRDSLSSFWYALGVLATCGVAVQFAKLWDEFIPDACPSAFPPLSAATVKLTGSNYGKLYPPSDGAASRPQPNPEVPHDLSQDTSLNGFSPPPLISSQEVMEPASLFSSVTEETMTPHEPEPTPLPATVINPASQGEAPGLPPDGQWLQALEVLQHNILEAQKNFQSTMAETHVTFLKTAFEHLGNLYGQASSIAPPQVDRQPLSPQPLPTTMPLSPMPPATEAPASMTTRQPASMENLSALSPQAPAASMPAPLAQPLSDTSPNARLDVDPNVEVVAQEAPLSDVLTISPEAFQQLLLQVVAEKTGYPEAVIELDMDLEADLGIDSIKRVEILSTLQETIPPLPREDMSQLATLSTLAEIIAFVTQAASSATPDLPAVPTPRPEATALIPSPILDTTVPTPTRHTIRAISTPPAGSALPGLYTANPLYLVHDHRGVAPLLQQKLSARGIKTKIVHDLPEGAPAVMWLPGLASRPDVERARQLNTSAFNLATACSRHQQAESGIFVTVQNTGGSFGIGRDPAQQAWLAGIGALAKTAAQEWPNATVKAIDIECDGQSNAHLANALCAELLQGGPELEVGLLANGKRLSLETFASPLPTTAVTMTHPIPDGAVVVVSGGAQGITPACLKALADGVAVKIAILGRTPITQESAELAHIESDSELKHALFERTQALGQNLTPLELAAQARHILANRTIRSTLQELKQRGAEVQYFTADVGDAKAVTDTLQTVRQTWGGIQVLIHAAGVVADAYLHDKSQDQFDRVLRTKAWGLHHLLTATQEDRLTHICCFSSVVARTGNAGQADYAMANELLNKVCQAEWHRRGGTCLVKSLNWGPWHGGMVGPELSRHFASMDIPLISLEQGASWFVHELQQQVEGEVEVILGAMPTHAALSHSASRSTF